MTDVDRVVERAPVVIVGAGPTGVTVATLLAQYGIECQILDRWWEVYPQPRAVHLDDEVYRILDRLGIADEFAAISRPALGLRLLDSRMRVLTEFSRNTALSRNGYPQANMFDQPDLEALLRTNLSRYPRAVLRGNVEVTDITEEKSGVRVSYTDRDSGAPHVVVADYVLACDGAGSLVRRRIGSRMDDLGFEQRWLVADVATSANLHQWDGVHQVCNPHRAGTYMRIGDTRYRWEFRLLDGETAADYATIDSLMALIRPWVEDISADQLDLVRVTEYTFRAQLAEHWRRGRVFLLGDAAHLTPPFIGQGMGAGLRDAMNLAWKVAGVINGTLSPEALDSYEQERKPHARSMIRLALTVGRAMTVGGLGNAIRRAVVPRLDRVPGLSSTIMDSETPALHRSALLDTSHAPWRLAGTLCPNPVIGDGGRLDSVLGNGFSLITMRTPDAGQQALIARRGAVVHIAEPGSELAHWLRRGRCRAALIRPDRAVMHTDSSIAELCDALPRFVSNSAASARTTR